MDIIDKQFSLCYTILIPINHGAGNERAGSAFQGCIAVGGNLFPGIFAGALLFAAESAIKKHFQYKKVVFISLNLLQNIEISDIMIETAFAEILAEERIFLMNKKTTDIVAYIGWIGWLISFFAGDRQNSKFHLNQALVLNLLSTILGILGQIGGFVALITSILSIVLLVFWIIGLVAACKGEEKPVPVIGGITILK